MDVNRKRKDRINEPEKKIGAVATQANPYHRTALKESTQRNQLLVKNGNHYAAMIKNPNNSANVALQTNINKPLDIVDECLNQVKSSGYVKPISKLERINGKIKAHVPEGLTCMVCNENLDQVSSRKCAVYSIDNH